MVAVGRLHRSKKRTQRSQGDDSSDFARSVPVTSHVAMAPDGAIA